LWYQVPAATRLELGTAAPFAIGAAVTVTLPERYLLLGALLVYGVPLAALLGGAVAGAALFGSDLAAALGSALGIGAALLGAPALRGRLERATLRELTVRPAGEPSS
jgi:positive regulator of sigma E activity